MQRTKWYSGKMPADKTAPSVSWEIADKTHIERLVLWYEFDFE